MSEEVWNGITLARVRNAFYERLSGAFRSVNRLIDTSQGIDYTFNTASTGAVIVSSDYLSWEFISPRNYKVVTSNDMTTQVHRTGVIVIVDVTCNFTVEELLDRLIAKTTSKQVSAWETFSTYLDGRKSFINMFLSEGGTASIENYHHDKTYSATQHKLGTITDFSSLLRWLKSWAGSDFLNANGKEICKFSTELVNDNGTEVAYATLSSIGFSLTARGTTIAVKVDF